MKKELAQNCWEYWNCPLYARKKCLAYQTNSGRECWMIANFFTSNKTHRPKVKRTFKYCWDCPWFKKLNPDFDE